MSLFGSIQMAGNTLQAMQIGLHVVGNNIANANTPGFIRERVLYTPAPVQKVGNLTLGNGVEIAGIIQNIDQFVEERLRDVGGDRASANIQQKVYEDLETTLDALGETDANTALTAFFNSIEEVVNHPEELGRRNLAVGAGKELIEIVNTLSRRVSTAFEEFSVGVDQLSSEMNSLTEQVRALNLKIVALEGGQSVANQAGGLRSQRNVALKRLAEIANVKITENQVGSVSVSMNGEILVHEGTRREVKTVYSSEGGRQVANIEYVDGGGPLQVTSGELHGMYAARDEIVGGFITKLDEFASTLAFEFNKVYSQGQGATGYSSITSVEQINDRHAVLDDAGLDFTPVNGSFNVNLYNTKTKLWTTHPIAVDLNGLQEDSSLATVVAQIDAIDGVTAEITTDNRLKVTAESTETVLAFEKDNSGFLAAIGINTFFTGSKAGNLAINAVVAADSSKFAASATGGVGVDVVNAQRLIALHDEGLTSLNGNSITGTYDQLINNTTQGSSVAASIADGFEVFEQTLEAQSQAVSGVNIDEEAIDMIMLQQTYQASARYISTLAELMDVLVAL